MKSITREDILRQLDIAIIMAISAIRSGDSASLLYADQTITMCHKLLGWNK